MSFKLQSHKGFSNKRFFPRHNAECQILYAIGSSARWRIATLINMSATGLLMDCTEPLLRNINVTIKTKPGVNRSVPSFTGNGKITRCDTIDKENHHYQISCKLVKITPSSK